MVVIQHRRLYTYLCKAFNRVSRGCYCLTSARPSLVRNKKKIIIIITAQHNGITPNTPNKQTERTAHGVGKHNKDAAAIEITKINDRLLLRSETLLWNRYAHRTAAAVLSKKMFVFNTTYPPTAWPLWHVCVTIFAPQGSKEKKKKTKFIYHNTIARDCYVSPYGFPSIVGSAKNKAPIDFDLSGAIGPSDCIIEKLLLNCCPESGRYLRYNICPRRDFGYARVHSFKTRPISRPLNTLISTAIPGVHKKNVSDGLHNNIILTCVNP